MIALQALPYGASCTSTSVSILEQRMQCRQQNCSATRREAMTSFSGE